MIFSFHESYQAIPFLKTPRMTSYCMHNKSQPLTMTYKGLNGQAPAYFVKFISWSSSFLEYSRSFLPCCLELPTSLPGRLTYHVAPPTLAPSHGCSLTLFTCQHQWCLFRKASSDYTFYMKLFCFLFCKNGSLFIFLVVLISTYNLKMCWLCYCLLLSLEGNIHMAGNLPSTQQGINNCWLN